MFQAPSASGEAPASPPASPLSVRVPALPFLSSCPLSVSASLPLRIVPFAPQPRMLASPLLWNSPPGAPLRPRSPPRNFSPLPSQFLSFNVRWRLLPPRAPLQPPLHFSVLGSPTHSALRASLGSPLLAAQPRSPRRDPRGACVPSRRRGCSVESGSGPESESGSGQVEGKMGRLGPVQLGPMSTRRRVPSAFPRDRGAPGLPLSRLPSLDPPRPQHNRCPFPF